MSSFNARIKSIFYKITLTALIALSLQLPAQAVSNEQKLIALSNWASISFADLFLNDYSVPTTGFGYLYTCFANINCIGIKNDQIDVLLNDNIVSVGPVTDMLDIMTRSNNGIVNFSGLAVNAETIPGTLSPGYGEITNISGQLIGVAWKMVIFEGTNQQQTHDLSVIIDISSTIKLINVTVSSQGLNATNLHQWSLFANPESEIAGISANAAKGTLEITKDITLPKISGGINTLTILKGGTLKIRL